MKIMCISKNNASFRAKPFVQDLPYKKMLQQGLKDAYGIKTNIENLESIVGPNELKYILTKLKSFQYQVGESFRANFHIHTNASDGSMSAKEFLELSKEWADKVFRDKEKDELPPFSAAITDHDSIKNVKEVIVQIAEEPEKYKNFKFISGCEFLFNGYKKPYTAFEAVGLGFNPFDKDLEPMTQGLHLSNNNIDDAHIVTRDGGILSWAHPIITPDKINEDFFTFLKSKGVDYIEGNYQYSHWDKEYIESIKPEIDKLIEKFGFKQTGGTDSHIKSIF